MHTNKRTLKILAALVWCIGFIALAIKSYRLFIEAYSLDSSFSLLLSMLLIGIVLGLLKTKYIFIKSCKKNILRIEALERPKIWQFYRIQFFIFLASMITLGAFFSSVAHGHYWFLMCVGVVDMALSLALLLSSKVFWKNFSL